MQITLSENYIYKRHSNLRKIVIQVLEGRGCGWYFFGKISENFDFD